MTYKELLKEGESYLFTRGVEEAGLDSWYIFSHCFHMKRSEYFIKENDEVAGSLRDAAAKFYSLIRTRGERIPLQYVLKSQDFMGLEFFVNSDVLIPRMDTEILAEQVIKDLTEGALPKDAPLKILDMCTGSGCIGISLACLIREMKITGELSVTLSDISEKALTVADINVKKNGCGMVCRTVKSDLFKAFDGQRFDIITCNPPYIESTVINGLAPEVKDHEPGEALDGGEDGLKYYRLMQKDITEHLNEGGLIYLEIGYDQGAEVRDLLDGAGLADIHIIKDLSGKDRAVRAEAPHK